MNGSGTGEARLLNVEHRQGKASWRTNCAVQGTMYGRYHGAAPALAGSAQAVAVRNHDAFTR